MELEGKACSEEQWRKHRIEYPMDINSPFPKNMDSPRPMSPALRIAFESYCEDQKRRTEIRSKGLEIVYDDGFCMVTRARQGETP